MRKNGYSGALGAAIREAGGKVLSEGEETLARDLKLAHIVFKREFQFCGTRKWQSDFLIAAADNYNIRRSNTRDILVEVEGGTRSGLSRHSRGDGFEKDCEKYNAASTLGYILLRFSTQQTKSGVALRTIKEAMR